MNEKFRFRWAEVGVLYTNLNELLAIFEVQKSCENCYFFDSYSYHKTNDNVTYGH